MFNDIAVGAFQFKAIKLKGNYIKVMGIEIKLETNEITL